MSRSYSRNLHLGALIGDWTIKENFSRGAQADIYVVSKINEYTTTDKCLMKVDKRPGKGAVDIETTVYSLLHDKFPQHNFAELYGNGTIQMKSRPELHRRDFIVMKRLGDTLHTLSSSGDPSKVTFVPRWTSSLVRQLQCTHKLNYVHRDVGQRNIVTGPPGSSSEHDVFLIDFASSAKFYDESKKEFIRSSVHDNSRRNDLVRLLKTMIKFVESISPKNKNSTHPTKKKLQETCTYVENLGDEQEPNYDRVCNMLSYVG